MKNIDQETVVGFGAEWSYFDQSDLSTDQLEDFERYFSIFPWEDLPKNPVGFDLGCGSGRWARLVAPRVGHLHCIDPSDAALQVARQNLATISNCSFHLAGVDDIPLPDESMDFGYAIGVLHHIPDPGAGLQACVRKLKTGAPFLIYIYYAFDNRPTWFRSIWLITDVLRRGISRMPFPLRYGFSQAIALGVYYPLARLSRALERTGVAVEHIPLSPYRHKSLYSMRTDALDRFGTKLEKRFTASKIDRLMREAGLEDRRFSRGVPYWCAVGRRAAPPPAPPTD